MQLFWLKPFALTMSASATLQPVIAVQGGGIDPTVELCGNAWVLKPTTVDGKRFVDNYTRQYHCKQFLNNNLAMVNYIKRLRNKKVHEFMRAAASNEDDPNAEVPEQCHYTLAETRID